MINSFFLEYYNAYKDKKIIVGKELIITLENLKIDIDNKNYKFDTSEAHKRIRFIENECKHSISPYAGKPFKLELWEKALLEVIYSFYILIDNEYIRRFTRVLLLCGRKNGKSTFTAGLSLSEFYCGNRGTNVLVASNTDDQTNILFNEINNMREESFQLEKTSRKNLNGIFMGNPKQKKKKGRFSYQNKAQVKKLTVRTGAKEGRNVDFTILDETHEFKNNILFMSLWQSMSTKNEPLLIEITTEGFTHEGHLDNVLLEARQNLKGEIINNRWLIWIYTQDNEAEIWQDKKSWYKSNPSLGICKKWNYLEELVEQAKGNASTRAFMLAKDFNLKQSSAIGWIQSNEIENLETFDLKEFENNYCIVGVDLAETTDLCAITLLFRKNNSKKNYLHSHYWIPMAKLKNSGDGVNYQDWAKKGFLTIVEENSVNVSIVADYIYNIYSEYSILPYKAGYDNKFSKDFLRQYINYFKADNIECVYQDYKTLNNPMRRLEADFKDKLVIYNNNPISFWCYCNTSIKMDNMGRIIPCKSGFGKRIDGTASAIICYSILYNYK
jgi:phage terminase large subunit-like protein